MRGGRGSACLFVLPFAPFSLDLLSSRRRRSSCSICRRPRMEDGRHTPRSPDPSAVSPAPAPGGLARQAGALPAAGSWGLRVSPHSLRFVPPPGGAGRGGVRAARPSRAAMGGGHLFALDFDGIFCDSCGESSLSAVKAAKVRWPWVFEQVDAAMEEWIVEQMHTVYSHIGLDCCYDSVDSDMLYHTAKQQSHRCSESSVSRPLAERQAGAAVAEHGGFTLRISCLSHYVSRQGDGVRTLCACLAVLRPEDAAEVAHEQMKEE